MIFKTIEDETTISGQRIVGALEARRIAQQQARVQLETDIACLKKYELACQSGSVSTEQFDTIMKKASITAKEYTVNIQNGTGSAQSYAPAQKANNAALQSVGVGAGIASKAVKALSATMNTIAITALFSLISKGISWVTEQINNYIHRNEIAIEKAEELLDTFNSEIDTITSNQDKINGYADEFEELAKGVDDLGRNVSLTADEYSRYQSIVKEIVGINPSLISGYDEENNILADKNGLIETSIQLLKDEYNQRLKNLALPDNIDTAIDGAIGRYNTAKGELQTAIDDIPNRLLSTSFGHIDDKGNISYGYANFGLADIFADVIGVDFDVKKQSQADYIYENMDAILDNMDAIKERASQTKDGIQGLSETQLIDLMDYLKELRILYTDMNNASSSANSTLQYVAMAEDSYSQLTDIQKKFIADYVNGIQITSDTTDQEKENIRKSIISLTQELAGLDDVEVNNALADLYAIPTDKQSTDEYIEQFRNALEIIKTYCKKNKFEIPIIISNKEEEINELESKYNAAISKFTGDANDVDLGKFFEDNSINDESEIDYWNKVTDGAKTATEAVEMYNNAKKKDDKIDVSLDTYKTASNSISSLSTAFKELTDNEYISLETISKIKESVGDSISNWDAYEQKLLSVKKGTAEYNQLMSELTYATLEKQLGGTSALAQADEKYIERILEENGVLNANQVAQDMIVKAKAAAAAESMKSEEANKKVTNSLIAQAEACGLTENQYKSLIAQEITFNDNGLDVSQRMSALKTLRGEITSTTAEMGVLDKFSSYMEEGKSKTQIAVDQGIDYRVKKDANGDDVLVKKRDINGNIVKDKNGNAIMVKDYEYEDDNGVWQDSLSDVLLSKAYEEVKKTIGEYKITTPDYSGNENDSKATKQSFNWIETALSRVQRTITNLGKTVSATYKSWTSRNNALGDEIAAVNKEIALQQDALSYYTKKADNVNLDPAIKDKVREGSISIEEYSGSDAELIQEYQEWYEKSLACEDALQDLNDQLATLAKTKFDNVANEFDNLLSGIEHDTSMLDAYINLTETKGQMVSAQYYDSLKAVEKENLSTLENKYTTLTAELNKAMNTGKMEMYSEEWYNMMSVINGVEQAIIESKTAMLEYDNALRDLDWSNFDKLQEKLSQVTEESNFLIDLISDEKLFDDSGNMTDYGQATLGLHTANYKTYVAQAEKYAEELEAINQKLATDPYNETLLERQEELLQSHRDMISAAEDEKQSIKDLYSDGYDVLLDNMSNVIDKRKDMFSQIKDLYDYEKNIAGQTKEIASLEKQLSAYQGDDSEETRTTIQQLKVSLEEAKENLEETEYDKYISDQEQMLDTLYDETEAWVNDRLDNIDGLLQDAIDSATLNADEIMSTLQTVASEAGITLSDKMDAIWSSGGSIGTLLTELQEWFADAKQTADESAKEQITAEVSSTPTTPNTNQSTAPTPVVVEPASTWGNWFTKKKDSYNKSKLNTESSIVDRLKYLDYDSSFEARASYYAAMGGMGTYTGSSAQNQWMLAQMKANAFANGGIVGDLIKRTGEDGFALVRRGEGIIPVDMMPEWEQLIQNLEPVNRVLEEAMNVRIPEVSNNTNHSVVNHNTFEFHMPNVTNGEETINYLQHSKRFENIIHEISFGKGHLTKYKY